MHIYDNILVPGMSYPELERRTLQFRSLIGVDGFELLDPIDVVQRAAGVLGPTYGLELIPVDDAAMGLNEAYAAFDPPKIYLRESIYSTPHSSRARFVIFHELGHIVLHRGAAKARKEVRNRRPVEMPAYKDSEWQANVFAATFAMPRCVVLSSQDAAELARRTGMGRKAASFRWDEVKRATPRVTPRYIAEGIARLRGDEHPRKFASVLSAEQNAKLAWETAPPNPERGDEFRVIDGRWLIKKDKFEHQGEQGWSWDGEKIVPWEAQNASHFDGEACRRCGNFARVRRQLHWVCQECGLVE